MTGLIECDGGPIWFFTANDNHLVQQLRGRGRAIATFAFEGTRPVCRPARQLERR
jgi:general stress protein 26